MTRKELIESDEYTIAAIEVMVVSGRGVKDTRQELTKYFLSLKNELIQSHESTIQELKDRIKELEAELQQKQKKSVFVNKPCVDCGKHCITVSDRGIFNGFQCWSCYKNQQAEDEECR